MLKEETGLQIHLAMVMGELAYPQRQLRDNPYSADEQPKQFNAWRMGYNDAMFPMEVVRR